MASGKLQSGGTDELGTPETMLDVQARKGRNEMTIEEGLEHAGMTPDFLRFVSSLVYATIKGSLQTDTDLDMLDMGFHYVMCVWSKQGKRTYTDEELCEALPEYCGSMFARGDQYEAARRISLFAIVDGIKQDKGESMCGKSH